MAGYKQLLTFRKEDLLFNEEETRTILKFIFTSTDYGIIDSLNINDHVKGFAQGLLIEAIDASYAIGFVEAIFRSTSNPTKGAMQILKTFGRKVEKHWFKHATMSDLLSVKIYDFIRLDLARKFRSHLSFMISGLPQNRFSAFLAYNKPENGFSKVWG